MLSLWISEVWMKFSYYLMSEHTVPSLTANTSTNINCLLDCRIRSPQTLGTGPSFRLRLTSSRALKVAKEFRLFKVRWIQYYFLQICYLYFMETELILKQVCRKTIKRASSFSLWKGVNLSGSLLKTELILLLGALSELLYVVLMSEHKINLNSTQWYRKKHT